MCELDFVLCHLHCTQAFVPSKLEEDVHMNLPESSGSLTGKVGRLNSSDFR